MTIGGRTGVGGELGDGLFRSVSHGGGSWRRPGSGEVGESVPRRGEGLVYSGRARSRSASTRWGCRCAERVGRQVVAKTCGSAPRAGDNVEISADHRVSAASMIVWRGDKGSFVECLGCVRRVGESRMEGGRPRRRAGCRQSKHRLVAGPWTGNRMRQGAIATRPHFSGDVHRFPASLSSAESCETTPSIRLSPSVLRPPKSAGRDRSSRWSCLWGAAKPWAVGTVQLRECPAACDAYGSATSDGLVWLLSLWTTSSSLCSTYLNDTLVQPPLSNRTTVRWALYSEPSSPREQWPFSDAQLGPRRPASGSKFAIFGRELDERSLLLDMGIWCVPPLRITLIC